MKAVVLARIRANQKPQKLRSGYAVHYDLGKSLSHLGAVAAALDHFQQAAQTPDPELRRKSLDAIACSVPGSPRANNASVLEARRLWARVEAAAELGNAANRASLYERFARWEIARDRLRLEGPALHGAFLAAYGNVDVALDTFPYNGGTTTMEALWQGVPVLTFHGDRWASRQSRSLLLAAGLDDWCQPDLDAYIARAITLGRSQATATELAPLRATMRERLANMPICDSAGLCTALESIYRRVAKV